MMDKIRKEELRPISYAEFGKLLDRLTDQVAASGVRFDLIVPILRSGAITGMHLASKLGVTNTLPAQYKYVYEPEETIVKKFEFPKLDFEVPEDANILVADTNTVWGGIARKVIQDVQTCWPKASIYFASANLDQSAKSLPDVRGVFWGALSNEKREMGADEARNAGISQDVIIFPWEDLEEQWEDINASQSQANLS